MSEAIENMDNIKSRLEELKESKKSAEKIKAAFDKYNNFVILDKAKDYVEYKNQLEKLEKEKSYSEKAKDKADKLYKEAEEKLKNLDIEKNMAEEKKRELDKHDSIKIREKIEQLKVSIDNLNKEKNSKEDLHKRKKEIESRIYEEIRLLNSNKESIESNLLKTLNNMEDISEEFSFEEQAFLKDEIEKDLCKEYSFSYVKNNLSKYTEDIDAALRSLEEGQRKNIEYDKALEALEKSKSEKQEKGKTLDAAKLLLIETREEYLEKLYGWKNNNQELKISEDSIVQVSREINKFHEGSSFDSIISIIRDEYNAFEGDFNKLKYESESNRDKWICLSKEKQSEIEEWKNKKDPEPFREEKVNINRTKLQERGIPFIPLYKAVDFKEDVSEQLKGRLEEALLDMGLLDALIIPEKYKNEILTLDTEGADKYLFSCPKLFNQDLSQLLKPEQLKDKEIPLEDIENILKSIAIAEDVEGTYINEKGDYSIGLVKGKVTSFYVSKFIGSSARNRYREEIVSKLSQELKEIESEILKCESELDNINGRLETLKNELNGLPEHKDLSTAVNEVKEADFQYEMISKEIIKKEEIERSVYEELKKIKEKIYELTYRIPLKVNVEIYREALEAAKDYRELLFELERSHGIFLQAFERIKLSENRREEILEDIDNILYDLSINERKLKEASINMNNCEEQLKLSDYEDIKNEIEECIRLLREIPEQIKVETRNSEREKSNYEQETKRQAEIIDKLELFEKLVNVYEEAFKEEADLGYVINQEDEETFKLAKRICREIVIDEKNVKEKEDYVNSLFQRFQENNQYLREYTVKIENIFEAEVENLEEDIKKVYGRRKRLDITGKVRGKEVSFYKLLDFILEGMEENEKLLRESDRQLFEDILVNNISKKIRAKIFHSEQWVKKMNELMESMNTSSGLSFSLRWSSKKAETEEQLDTKELVTLLKQDGNLLKDSDLNKLSEHFRSKIAEARRKLEDKGQNQTFHSIMREVLDYRKWFEFKLYFVKTGGNKKELTNNAFYQFSGGEKAMAMYVPLFSAVYAKYEGAKKECPRIVSLDEAFAGVDERNIRDMFRLLNELDLNYVINSQILWGDYDTVPSLSISELIRPDNADYVTVIRYNWNGKVKELVI